MAFAFPISSGVRLAVLDAGPRVYRPQPEAAPGGGEPLVFNGSPVSFHHLLRPSAATRTSLREYERRLAALGPTPPEEVLAEVVAAITTAHHGDYPPAQRPAAPVPAPVALENVRPAFERDAMARKGVFEGRAQALHQAGTAAASAVETERRRREAAHAGWQRDLDQRWEALNRNDPKITVAALTEAFVDSDVPAAAVAVVHQTVSLVVFAPAFEALPARVLGGNGERELSTQERDSLVADVVAGYALVTLRTAFAVAPGLAAARLVVLRSPANRGVECVFAAGFSRASIEQTRWGDAEAVALVDRLAEQSVHRPLSGAQGPRALDVSTEPDLTRLLRAVDAQVSAPSVESKTEPLALPVIVTGEYGGVEPGPTPDVSSAPPRSQNALIVALLVLLVALCVVLVLLLAR